MSYLTIILFTKKNRSHSLSNDNPSFLNYIHITVYFKTFRCLALKETLPSPTRRCLWSSPSPSSPCQDFVCQIPVLRIQNVYPGSRILIFTHPGSRIQKQQQKRRMKKKIFVIPFFVDTSFTTL